MNWHDYFIADFKAGTLTWKPRPREHFPTEQGWKISNARFAGRVAGGNNVKGYQQVMINYKIYPLHRIIYEMAHGPIAKGLEIDHINGVKDDNRMENLRLATSSQNGMNKGAQRNNKSGYKGVRWHKRRWIVEISIDGRQTHIGSFTDVEIAAEAYIAAAKIHHKEFRHRT